MRIVNVIIGIVLIVGGALMIADSVMIELGKEAIFFNVPDVWFEAITGLALVILGASKIDSHHQDGCGCGK